MTKNLKPGMVLVGDVRYREKDARKLGLIADGKVLTARSVERQRTTDAPNGLVTSAALNPDKGDEKQPGDEKPAKGDKKAAWVEYAKAHGVQDADELTKDQLVDLFTE